MSSRLQQDLSRALRLEIGVGPSRVCHHPRGVSAGAQGQVGGRVGIRSVGGEIGGGGQVGHAGERRLRLVLVLVRGVGRLELVGGVVILLARGQIVKQRAEDDKKLEKKVFSETPCCSVRLLYTQSSNP